MLPISTAHMCLRVVRVFSKKKKKKVLFICHHSKENMQMESGKMRSCDPTYERNFTTVQTKKMYRRRVSVCVFELS